MIHQKEKETLEELRQILNKAKFLIDDLNDNGVKLRIKIGQGPITQQKVFRHGDSRKRAVLYVSEAIKHVPLENPTTLKKRELDGKD